MNRFTYAFGYRSVELAGAAILDMISSGEISWSERPDIERYRNRDGVKRWRIVIDG